LRRRYEDERTTWAKTKEGLQNFAKQRGVDLEQIPDEIKETLFASDQEKTSQALEKIIEGFFNSEQASKNPEKLALVKKQTEQYLSLLKRAQEEGSIAKDLSAEDVYRLVGENIAVLALQDRIACENTLGDHGVRHIISHNIEVSMTLADQLAARGVPISAMDRLILQQVMIYHDFGYATTPIVEGIRNEGIKDQDAGHNVLGAKIFRERFSDQNDTLRKVFGKEELELIHRGVLFHDKDERGKSSVGFNLEKEQTQETRRQNLESIIRTADNTHAFEDKLPELLYRIPESLKYLRLMKTAGEVNDQTAIEKLKHKLMTTIGDKTELSDDDKLALRSAVQSLGAESYKFNVDRICGNKPAYTINESGQLQITVQVSEIHQEVIRLFGQESYKQLVKFIKDACDVSLVGDLPVVVESADGKVAVIQKGVVGKSDYQKAVERLVIHDEQLRDFLLADEKLQRQIAVLDRQIAKKDSLCDKNHLRTLKERAVGGRRKLLEVFY
jgi:hypothetical protein